MAKTLLNAVNSIFQRVGLVAGDAGLLTSLTDSSRQVSVDQAVQAINEVISELYTATDSPMPSEQKEGTVVLATGTRAYSLPTDLIQIRWPLIDRANFQFITDFPGGYNELLLLDVAQTFTGLPHWGCIRPTDGKLYLDRAPTTAENGRTYYLQYDKSLLLSAASDTVPFDDDIFTSLVPAFVQIWKREARNEYDADLMKAAMGRAGRLGKMTQDRSSWSPR